MKLREKLSNLFLVLQRFLMKKQENFKVNKLNELNVLESNQNLLEELDQVQNQLQLAHVIFNFQTNIDLVASSIYYIDALETKYNYLIKEARKRQLRCALKPV